MVNVELMGLYFSYSTGKDTLAMLIRRFPGYQLCVSAKRANSILDVIKTCYFNFYGFGIDEVVLFVLWKTY